MPAKVFSGAIFGLNGIVIEVEVDLTPGLHAFQLVGLADKAIAESKERLAAAIKNSGATPPHQLNRRIIINLAPADLKKEGSLYDLAIAVGYLAASEQIASVRDLGHVFLIGELSLDGLLRPATGILPLAIEARAHGFEYLIVPKENRHEAAHVPGIAVIGAETLRQVIDFLEGTAEIPPAGVLLEETVAPPASTALDFAHIRGQEAAKRAFEIVAAGGHHALLMGQPGGGKTLLAQALPSILPPMTPEETVEVTKIWSVAGMLPRQSGLLAARPFRAPHHTASGIALVGGGTWPRPGEITLAHRGILFLDEFAEFERNVLENLRQPLEEGTITIARAQGSVTFPARFQLVAAMNPCPCGFAGDPKRHCTCPASAIFRYRRKVSGPILDRIDIHIDVPTVDYEKLIEGQEAEPSANIRERVARAHSIQQERFTGSGTRSNAEIRMQDIERFIPLSPSVRGTLKSAVTAYQLSARAYHRVLKVMRTIADLEGSEAPSVDNALEALQYRPKEVGGA